MNLHFCIHEVKFHTIGSLPHGDIICSIRDSKELNLQILFRKNLILQLKILELAIIATNLLSFSKTKSDPAGPYTN